ncbi:Esterase YbfF [Roseovarius albus]|uniref:Esterase YbfF n=1 Tax=Roseovarius albus TaxID=1247867 RepID=A0A1X6YRQ4_9RHOB|nr:alpha/beta fold hydrolase [Roseovarius albus]SLN28684.1 Esterase YbfF [Roseovarius albus]
MLNMIEHGAPTEKPGLVIVHGLYGSGRNWGVIAKRLSDERHVVAVDMRNHGASKWTKTHNYPEMAEDLAEVLRSLDGPYDVLGHSMGGKASMTLALTQPELINRLIVADIAPVAYSHTQLQYVKAMQSVDLSKVSRKTDAVPMLETYVDDPQLVSFFLQSLDAPNKRWVLNLETLEAEMPEIMGFPDLDGAYNGQVLFLSGAQSDYVKPEYRDRIKALFPAAKFMKIPGAGHWLHAQKPREFEAAVRAWLNRD